MCRPALCHDLDETLFDICLGLLMGWEEGELALSCHTARVVQGRIATWLHFGCRVSRTTFVAEGNGSRPPRYGSQGRDVCKGAAEAFIAFVSFAACALGLSTGIIIEVIPSLVVNGVAIFIFSDTT